MIERPYALDAQPGVWSGWFIVRDSIGRIVALVRDADVAQRMVRMLNEEPVTEQGDEAGR